VLSEEQTHVPEGGQVTAMPLLLTS